MNTKVCTGSLCYLKCICATSNFKHLTGLLKLTSDLNINWYKLKGERSSNKREAESSVDPLFYCLLKLRDKFAVPGPPQVTCDLTLTFWVSLTNDDDDDDDDIIIIVFLCFSVFGTFFDINASAFFKIQVWNYLLL